MRSLVSSLVVAAIVLVTIAPARADDSVATRLDRLEAEIDALRHENQQLRAQLGLDGRTAGGRAPADVTAAGLEPTLRVGGMLQIQGEFGDRGDSRFGSEFDRIYVRRARMNVSGRFLGQFDFRVELELAGSLGEASGLRAQATDAWINWHRFAWANVRLGQFKTPFGYEQLFGDPQLLTIERSLVNDRLTVSRQIGVQVSGDVLDHRVSYATGVFNGNGVNTSANDNNQFLWIGRVGATPWRPKGRDLRWSFGLDALASNDAAVSYASDFGFDAVPGGTRDNVFAGHREEVGVDSQLHAGRFDLWGEYLRARFEPNDRLPAGRFDADGWYVLAGYFLVPKTFQGVVKFETFDPDTDLGGDTTRTWTFGTNFYFKADDVKLQFDYLLADVPGLSSQENKVIVRVQTVF